MHVNKIQDFFSKYREIRDINALKKVLSVDIPDHFRNTGWKWELPFPPVYVVGIREEDVDFLQDAFHLSDAQRYSEWALEYYKLNIFFLAEKLDDVFDEVNKLIQNMRNAASDDVLQGLPSAPLIFMLSKAYLSERYKEGILPHRNDWRESLDILGQQADKFGSAVSELIGTIDAADSKQRSWAGVAKSCIGKKIKDHGLEESLEELKIAIWEGNLQALQSFAIWYKTDHEELPDSLNSMTDHTYLAFEGIARLIEKNWRKRGSQQLARRWLGSSPAMSVKRRSAWGGYSLSSSISR